MQNDQHMFFQFNSPYVGTNLTENATAEIALYLFSTAPDGTTPTSNIAASTDYNLTDTVYIEADIVNNTDKFVATVSLKKKNF